MVLFYASLVTLVAAAAAVEPRITASGCGQTPARSNTSISQHIVGGIEADPYSWPFIYTWRQRLQVEPEAVPIYHLDRAQEDTIFRMRTGHCVVSWGYGCARPQYPGVYADVYNLRNWLNSKING